MKRRRRKVGVKDIVPVPGDSFEQTLNAASPDLPREMVRAFAQKMMDAEVEVACGAAYGEVSPNRVNSRNGCRHREWDTRGGTVELAVPKLRHGSYFPSFLEYGRHAERALAQVVATSYLMGVSLLIVRQAACPPGGRAAVVARDPTEDPQPRVSRRRTGGVADLGAACHRGRAIVCTDPGGTLRWPMSPCGTRTSPSR
jgi:hypothetical protein